MKAVKRHAALSMGASIIDLYQYADLQQYTGDNLNGSYKI
jgi:hypothetical protein